MSSQRIAKRRYCLLLHDLRNTSLEYNMWSVKQLLEQNPQDPNKSEPVPAHIAAEISGHTLGDVVAARTESAREAEIDAANGLRHHSGRSPTPEDFDGILSPEGNSGDTTGSEVVDSAFVFGETGSTGGTML